MYYGNGDVREGRICLFNSHTNSVEQIGKYTGHYGSHEVVTTKNKVGYFICHCQFCKFQIFGIDNYKKSFEIYDLNTRQISKGLLNKSLNDRIQRILQVQFLLNGVNMHLWLISKTNCII